MPNAPMTISLNGKPHDLPAPCTVSELLVSLGLAEKPVVIELNREPLLPADHATARIEAGATIEIVTLAAGG